MFLQFGLVPGNPIPCNLTSSSHSHSFSRCLSLWGLLYMEVSHSVSKFKHASYGVNQRKEMFKASLRRSHFKRFFPYLSPIRNLQFIYQQWYKYNHYLYIIIYIHFISHILEGPLLNTFLTVFSILFPFILGNFILVNKWLLIDIHLLILICTLIYI